MLEEAHVRHLDLRDHGVPAALARGGDREPHEQRAEVPHARLRQHREPVALPQALDQGVQPDGAGDRAAVDAHHVEGVRRHVALVAVVTREQSLVEHEHAVAHGVMGGQLAGRLDEPAGERANGG